MRTVTLATLALAWPIAAHAQLEQHSDSANDGLIKAVGALSSAAPAQRSALLSQGISEAMWNTALGLGIAVFCMIFHLILHSWSKGIKLDMERSTMKLENLLLLKK